MSEITAKSPKSIGALSARGERARAGLKEAALAVLEREGYHKMRIADVTGEAGVAQGLFYLFQGPEVPYIGGSHGFLHGQQ